MASSAHQAFISLVPLTDDLAPLDNATHPVRFIALPTKSGSKSFQLGRSSKNGARHLRPAEDNAWFESPVISRQHAVMEIDGKNKEIFLTDSKSLHGTLLDGKTVPPETKTPVKHKQILTLGTTVYRGQETFSPRKFRVEIQWTVFRLKSPKESKVAVSSNQYTVPVSDAEDSESEDNASNDGYESGDSLCDASGNLRYPLTQAVSFSRSQPEGQTRSRRDFMAESPAELPVSQSNIKQEEESVESGELLIKLYPDLYEDSCGEESLSKWSEQHLREDDEFYENLDKKVSGAEETSIAEGKSKSIAPSSLSRSYLPPSVEDDINEDDTSLPSSAEEYIGEIVSPQTPQRPRTFTVSQSELKSPTRVTIESLVNKESKALLQPSADFNSSDLESFIELGQEVISHKKTKESTKDSPKPKVQPPPVKVSFDAQSPKTGTKRKAMDISTLVEAETSFDSFVESMDPIEWEPEDYDPVHGLNEAEKKASSASADWLCKQLTTKVKANEPTVLSSKDTANGVASPVLISEALNPDKSAASIRSGGEATEHSRKKRRISGFFASTVAGMAMGAFGVVYGLAATAPPLI